MNLFLSEGQGWRAEKDPELSFSGLRVPVNEVLRSRWKSSAAAAVKAAASIRCKASKIVEDERKGRREGYSWGGRVTVGGCDRGGHSHGEEDVKSAVQKTIMKTPAEARLQNLVDFVKERGGEKQWLDESEIKAKITEARERSVPDGLMLSDSLQKLSQVLRSVSDDLASLTRDKNDVAGENSLEDHLESSKLPDQLLKQWYLRFFTSLELAERVSKIAMESSTLSEANRHFNPTDFLSSREDKLALFNKFWSDAADLLAEASVKALEAKVAYQAVNTGKFDGEMKLGDLDAFYVGLDGVIGLPKKLNFLEAMQAEHEDKEVFEAYNQGAKRKTSPFEEWRRVYDKGKINNKSYDGKEDMCKRNGADCDNFMAHPKVKESGLTQVEVIALRLYTSPMYQLYNGELRELLEKYKEVLAEKERDLQTSGDKLDCKTQLEQDDDGTGFGRSCSSDNFKLAAMREECLNKAREQCKPGGLRYVTTIHAISSGMLKLVRSAPSHGKIYRGIRGKDLPPCFFDALGDRGGVEYGFMSTSREKVQAFGYAVPEVVKGVAKQADNGMPIVMEISTGMIDRGADVSWLSYFPSEQEILLPPLSSLELRGFPRFEEAGDVMESQNGAAERKAEDAAREQTLVMVLPLRVNINLRGSTLQELFQRRKKLHLEMFKNLVDELERELLFPGSQHMPSAESQSVLAFEDGKVDGDHVRKDFQEWKQAVLEECREAMEEHKKIAHDKYNLDETYKSLWEKALETKVRAKRKLKALVRRCLEASAPADTALAILKEPLEKFSDDKEYYRMLTGQEEDQIPWSKIVDSPHEAVAGVQLLEAVPASLKQSARGFSAAARNVRSILRCFSRNSASVTSFSYGTFTLGQSSLGAGKQQHRGKAKSDSIDFGALHIRRLDTLRSGSGSAGVKGAESVELTGFRRVLSRDGGRLVASILLSSKHLVELHLAGCQLFTPGAELLAHALAQVGSGLRSLDLGDCALGLRGGEAVFSSLADFSLLESLSLRKNALSETAWLNLATFLAKCAGLRHLDLSYCSLPLPNHKLPAPPLSPAPAFLESLKSTTRLQYLDLTGSIAKETLTRSVDSSKALDQSGPKPKRTVAVLADLIDDRLSLLTSLNGLALPHRDARDLNSSWDEAKLDIYDRDVDGGLVEAFLKRYAQLTILTKLEASQAEVAGEGAQWKPKTAGVAVTFLHRVQHNVEYFEEACLSGVEACMPIVSRIDLGSEHRFAFSSKIENFGGQLLILAAQHGLEPVVHALLLKGVAVDYVSRYDGQTALVRASGNGCDSIVEMLVAHGASVTSVDSRGATALMEAAKGGHSETVKLLLKQPEGAGTLDLQDKKGNTALMLAVKNQHAAAVKDLVECACRKDVSVSLFAMMSKDTDELLMAAASNGLSVVIESNRHGEREPEKETEPERNSVTVAEWLLIAVEKELEDAERRDAELKALVGKVNVKGRTALMEAALNGQKEVVKALLTRGADMDKESRIEGWTPLMFAADKGHLATVKLLLESGASKKKVRGMTALKLAKVQGHDAVAKCLDNDFSDKDDKDALQITVKEVPLEQWKNCLRARDMYDLMGNHRRVICLKLDARAFQLQASLVASARDLVLGVTKDVRTIDMYASPLWAVTLQTEQKASVKIPKDAIYFSFCHPLRNLPSQLDVDEVHANAEQSSLVAFLLVGGFMYFNKDYEIIHINSLHVKHVIHLPADHEAGQPPSAGSGSESRLMLERWGLDMQPRSVELLDRWSRWQPITAPALKKQFEEFTWVGPSEMLCDRWINPYGGFAYRAANSETAVFYAIRLPGEYNVLYGPENPFTVRFDEPDTEAGGGRGADTATQMRAPSSRAKTPRLDAGVTGLVEVRAEAAERLRIHLLAFAKEMRAAARAAREAAEAEGGTQRGPSFGRRRLSHYRVYTGPSQSPESGLSTEEAQPFNIKDPSTWREVDLPSIYEDDDAEERKEKMQLLLEAHEFCARRIRMWTVWNLLPLRAIQGKSISECIFCSDILSLTQVGRQRVELTLKLGAVEATMTGSPLNQVTLPEEVQVRGGIPREAKFFCFCYPPRKQAKGLPEAIRSFLRLGGFLYFNDSFEVVSLSALSDCASNKQETRSVLHLGPPLPMPQSAMDSIGATRRWWRVARKKTLTAAKALGYSHFTWVRPSEVLADHVFCGHGGFAYCDRKEGRGDYYPVLQSIFDVDCSEKPGSQYLQKYQPHRWRRPVDGMPSVVTWLHTSVRGIRRSSAPVNCDSDPDAGSEDESELSDGSDAGDDQRSEEGLASPDRLLSGISEEGPSPRAKTEAGDDGGVEEGDGAQQASSARGRRRTGARGGRAPL